jgi:hypothetical protein
MLCGIRKGHHNTQLRHIIGLHKKLKRLTTRTPTENPGVTDDPEVPAFNKTPIVLLIKM